MSYNISQRLKGRTDMMQVSYGYQATNLTCRSSSLLMSRDIDIIYTNDIFQSLSSEMTFGVLLYSARF